MKRKGGIGLPAHQCFKIRAIDLFLWVSLILSLLLLFQSVVSANIEQFSFNSAIVGLKLVDTSSALNSILVVIGIMIVERKYNDSVTPLIQTSMINHDDYKLGVANDCDQSDHYCYLRNMGSGRAVIRAVSYRVEFYNEIDETAEEFKHTFFSLLHEFEKRGLVYDKHFFMPRIAENVTYIPPDSRQLIHISDKFFDSSVKHLEIHLEYENSLGRRYLKDFPILPSYGRDRN